MAKKVSLEEYNEKLNKNIIDKKKRIKKLIITNRIITVLLVLSVLFITLFLYYEDDTETLQEELESQEYLAKEYKSELKRLTGDKTVEYIETKLSFYDESVVYVVDELGNYYYSYDCLIKKIGNEEFSYMAYNPDAAKAEGYKKGAC